MDISNKAELQVAIRELRGILGVDVPKDVLAEYLAGRSPHAVGYEKLVGQQQELPAITKYLLVAESYLAQPSIANFYDIYRAGRAIPLLRRLHVAVRGLSDAGIVGFTQRLERAARTIAFDDFDSAIFELVVAAAYGEAVGFSCIEFLPERHEATTPDLLVHAPDGDIPIECKRFGRMTDASVALRDEARDVSHVVLRALQESGIAAAVELRFTARPSDTRADEIVAAVLRSVRDGLGPQIVTGAHVAVRRLQLEPLPNLVLHPSPSYLHDRYGYSPEQWHGIVPGLSGTLAGPSFLDEVHWEAAVLWRVDDEALMWSIKRLSFARIFEGLEQLQTIGTRGVLHIWAERGTEHGHREAQLSKLVDTLERRAKDKFSWIIANETIADVSVDGRFDFQEHATPIAGLEASPCGPLVTAVFVGPEDIHGVGEWGIGLPLPPIDDGDV